MKDIFLFYKLIIIIIFIKNLFAKDLDSFINIINSILNNYKINKKKTNF